MVSKVRGRFALLAAELNVAEGHGGTTVNATIDASSFTTGDEQRDAHVVSADFLNVAEFPTLTFALKELAETGAGISATGALTIRDVTRDVTLDAEFLGEVTAPWGNTRVAFSATPSIDREDFGITWNQALEAGGVLVGKTVAIEIDAQFVKNA